MLDIAPTICYVALDKSKCSSKKYEGINLLAPIDQNRKRSVFIASEKHDNRDISYYNRHSVHGNAKLAVQEIYKQYKDKADK